MAAEKRDRVGRNVWLDGRRREQNGERATERANKRHTNTTRLDSTGLNERTNERANAPPVFARPTLAAAVYTHRDDCPPNASRRRLSIKTVRDNYDPKSHKCVRIRTYEPDTKSNPIPNPKPNRTTKQHAVVSIQLNRVTCSTYIQINSYETTLLHRLGDFRL